jgi:hypothetical protein
MNNRFTVREYRDSWTSFVSFWVWDTRKRRVECESDTKSNARAIAGFLNSQERQAHFQEISQ